MLKNTLCGLVIVLLISPGSVIAQTAEGGRPDEGTSWKYFYFHKPDISDEQARADVIECYGYTERLTVPKAGSNPTYSSVPYGGSTGLNYATAALVSGISGLTGAIITGFMDAGGRRAMERTNLRKCFGFKGYQRYELTKEEHSDLHKGDTEIVRARLIGKATGPAPAADRLVP